MLDEWLKDREGQTLSYNDIRHYQEILVFLSGTRLTAGVDGIVPGWPLG